MKISEIYTALASGSLLEEGTRDISMIAIELLARVEGTPVAALDYSAPQFALTYPFGKTDLRGFWTGATHYNSWRSCILNAQMQAAPCNTDGDPWASLHRAERLCSPPHARGCYYLAACLPEGCPPSEVTDQIIPATYKNLNNLSDQNRFRADVNRMRQMFDYDFMVLTGLLPKVKPSSLPGLRDHYRSTPMAPEIETKRGALTCRSTVQALDYINRLAVAGELLNGVSDTLENLRRALVALPDPADVGVPPITQRALHQYIRELIKELGGRDYRLSEVEQAWSDLRRAARSAGCDTSFLWALGKPAAAEGIYPLEVSKANALEIIRSYRDSSMPTQCRRGCEQFDALRGQVSSALLPPEPLGIRREPRKEKKLPPPKSPIVVAWDDLYAEINRSEPLKDNYKYIGYIKCEAIKARKTPDDITQAWLEMLRDTCPRDRLSAVYRGVKNLRKIARFEHLKPLRTRRQRHDGLPEKLDRELEDCLAEMGLAATTYRQFKLATGVLGEHLNLGEEAGMEDICEVDLEEVEWSCPPQQMKIYSAKIIGLQRYCALPWTSEWKALQKIVVNAGIKISKNPVPKLLAWEPTSSPKKVSLEWAQKLDRELRSTILNGPHGRADLAKTMAKHVAAFDKLREIPAVADSGLMPEPIGEVRG